MVGGADGDTASSSSCLATSIEVATSLAFEGAIRCFGGTTTVGPSERFSLEAPLELRRRMKCTPSETIKDGADMLAG